MPKTQVTLRNIEMRAPLTEVQTDGPYKGQRLTIRDMHYRLTFEVQSGREFMQVSVDIDRFQHGRQKKHKTIEQLEQDGRALIKRMLAVL